MKIETISHELQGVKSHQEEASVPSCPLNAAIPGIVLSYPGQGCIQTFLQGGAKNGFQKSRAKAERVGHK